MEFADGVETVSPSGLRDGRPFLAAPAHRRVVSDALLFPTLLTSLQPDYFLAYRLHPLSASRTRVAAETFVHPALADHSSLAELFAFWDTVNAEDRAVCESQQIGVGSRGYRASGYTSVEDGVHAFDVRVARAYLALYGDGGDGGGSDQASTSS
jgi:Rieske 2Fe-2S family protein